MSAMELNNGKGGNPFKLVKFDNVADFGKHCVEKYRSEGFSAISERTLKVGEVNADAFECIFKGNGEDYDFYAFKSLTSHRNLKLET